jgi:RNA polymerase sigma-70 factor (ECF subfamily)
LTTTTRPAPPVVAPQDNETTVVFEELYAESAQAIYNFVLRSVRDVDLAQDICQETWTKAYRGLPAVRDTAAVRAWLYRIARHAIIDAARKRRTVPATVAMEIEPLSSMSDPADIAAHTERLALAWQALGALPTRQSMALYLKEVEGRRYSEIASILECTESAVETLLCRARRAFAGAYEGLAQDRAERCAQARRVITVWLDGEGSPLLRRALNAHINECADCREVASVSERCAQARAAIPLAAPLLGTPWAGTAATATGSAAAHVPLRALLAKLFDGFAF